MPLKKLQFKPGVNRENTRYTNEGGYFESDKVRFRQGTPEKIGGWVRTSANTFLGVCRSLFQWVTLAQFRYTGVGTNLKFYIESGTAYYDVTPLRTTVTLAANPFRATLGSSVITVTAAAHGALDGAFVTFSGAAGLGGNITATVLNKEYQLTYVGVNTYTITVAATAIAADVTGSPGGGAAVSAAYQINPGYASTVAVVGWGAGNWGYGTWGFGQTAVEKLRLWTQCNFGENLLFNPRYGAIYYWTASGGLSARAVNITSLPGASDPPVVALNVVVSDVSRFVIAFGTNTIGSAVQDPMYIRWSDQESVTMWTPAATNQAGGIRLSHGYEIVATLQTRQEILIWTDSSMYSMQYVGYPAVWSVQLLADAITIISPNAQAVAAGVTYWMGVDKFYKYDGHVSTLRCDLRQFIFSDINQQEAYQIFGATNEGFNEIWWFYCTSGSTTVNRYVVYNYVEDAWYYGSMARTAWLDSGVTTQPIAATYSQNIVTHETGLDDNESGVPQPIDAYIVTSEFDIDDGHNFGFVWRLIPDMTFDGSTNAAPTATMTLMPMQNSGSGYNNPMSVAGSASGSVVRTSTVTIEQFTGQLYIRVRGRQMAFKIETNQLGTTWQLGAPRIDIRPDGRR